MRFPNPERFLRYCVSKRRTYLRQLFERRSPRGFFDLWKAQFDFAGGRIDVDGLSAEQRGDLGRELGWLLMQDLHQVVRGAAPDFPPAPPSLLAALPGALFQVRNAHSMLIAGEAGVGKEQLAILLHVLSGRPGALVRLAAPELAREPRTPARQLMPERGSVFLGTLEGIDATSQEELLAFLNGEARRRDLLFFVSTCREPRTLVTTAGIRRDLFVRVSQTEVRLPALAARPGDVPSIIGDVVYDLVRVPPARLPALRSDARGLSEEWKHEVTVQPPGTYDLFSEALSYVMWLEKKDLARAILPEVSARVAREAATAPTPAELRDIVADAFDALVRPAKDPAAAAGPPAAQTTQIGGTGQPGPLGAVAAPSPGTTRSLFPGARPGSQPEAPHPSAPAPAGVPTSMGRDDLLRGYYRALLVEERGDLRRVALRAGRPIRSLHAELARLGVRVGSASLATLRPEGS